MEYKHLLKVYWASQVAQVVNNPPANAEDIRDSGSIPGLERSPAGGHGGPLQYSCLEKPKDRGALVVTVHGVTKRWSGLKQFNTHTHTHTHTQKYMLPGRPGENVISNIIPYSSHKETKAFHLV